MAGTSLLGWQGRRARTCIVAAVLFGALLVPAGTVAASDFDLSPVRVIGGPGHAGLYGWGATTMLDGSVLIGDYWNYRVLQLSASGQLIKTFVANRGFGPQQHQAPYGLGTDPRNGDVYMADTDRRRVIKYDKDGRFLLAFGQQGDGPNRFRYPSRVAVASDGRVYVADTWANNITVHRPDGVELFEFGTFGSGPGQFRQPHGIAFDGQDRLFVVNTQNHRVDAFTTEGQFLFSFGSKGGSPGQFAGDVRGLAIDQANEWVYVVDGQGNRVHKFTTSGTFLLRWGSTGSDPGQFDDGGREVTVAGDGSVWVGDMPNFRAQRFSSSGQLLNVYPDPQQPPPPGLFNTPRGVAVDAAGNVFVSDTYNFRLQKLGPDGSFISQWGRRGRSEFGLNYTRLMATDPRNGDLLVADTDNHRIKRYSNDGAFVWQVGGLGGGANQYRNPHAVDVGPDGKIYVTDTNNDRVQVLDQHGNHLLSFGSNGVGDGQFRFPRGVAVDPANGDIFVADSGRDIIQRFNAAGQYLSRVASKGLDDHQLDGPFGLAILGDHLVVADTPTNKIKVFTRAGAFVAAYGGRGTTLDRFIKPMGLDVSADGQRLYVADAENERIVEYWVTTPDGTEPPPPPVEDTTAPDTDIVVPTMGATVPVGTMTFSGDATDDVAVESVRIAVQNRDTKQWYRLDGTWGTFQAHQAALVSPGTTDTQWSFDWDAPAGRWVVQAVAVDSAGNTDTSRSFRRFDAVASEDPPPTSAEDTTAPETDIVVPTMDATVPVGTMTFSGDATDDVAVESVRIAVQNRDTKQWYRLDGTWGTFQAHQAALVSPGTTDTQWSFDWDAPAGRWVVQAVAVDSAGNTDTSRSFRRFDAQ